MMIKKGIADLSESDFEKGEILLIDKPAGWTSFRVVHKIRSASGARKVGHAGTLDPFATGLLILATGKKTKEIINYQKLEKTYSGTITLGISSPSMDPETEPDAHYSLDNITEKKITDARDSFIGSIFQVPPMYSAIKLNGKTLYNLARKGTMIELNAREVEVKKFEIKNITLPYIDFEIVCSKGTYIRSIANDLGKKLGCGGILSSLRRLKIGEYSVEEAFGMDMILELLRNRTLVPGLLLFLFASKSFIFTSLQNI